MSRKIYFPQYFMLLISPFLDLLMIGILFLHPIKPLKKTQSIQHLLTSGSAGSYPTSPQLRWYSLLQAILFLPVICVTAALFSYLSTKSIFIGNLNLPAQREPQNSVYIRLSFTVSSYPCLDQRNFPISLYVQGETWALLFTPLPFPPPLAPATETYSFHLLSLKFTFSSLTPLPYFSPSLSFSCPRELSD